MRLADIIIPALVAMSACVHNPAPKGWLQPAPLSEPDPYGAWIEVHPAASRPAIAGEFLAVDHDSVYILAPQGFLTATAIADVPRARIAFYDAQNPTMVLGNTLGTLSTLSHGILLVATAPLLWGGIGSAIVARNSRLPIVDVKTPGAWAEARKYARFPAGLPANLPRQLPVKK